MNCFTIAAVLTQSFSSLLIDSTIKSSFILTLAVGIVLLLRRDSAATRHLAWFVAMAAILLIPIFSITLPQWQILPTWTALINIDEPANIDEDTITQNPIRTASSATVGSMLRQKTWRSLS